MIKTKVDPNACIACGACVAIDDSVFQPNEEGIAEVVTTFNYDTASVETKNNIEDAINGCPTGAISNE